MGRRAGPPAGALAGPDPLGRPAPAASHAGGVARDDRAGSDVARDDGGGPDDGVLAGGDAGEDGGVGADAGVGAQGARSGAWRSMSAMAVRFSLRSLPSPPSGNFGPGAARPRCDDASQRA